MPVNNKFTKQVQLLQMIADTIWLHGYQPSLRELARRMGWRSPGYVQSLLKDLQTKKIVSYDNQARAISFVWQDFVSPEALSRYDKQTLAANPRRGIAVQALKRSARAVGQVS